MQALAPRQLEVYKSILDYWREVGRAPSLKDLETRLGMTSMPLRRHLRILQEKGLLAPRRHNTARDIYLAKPVGEAAKAEQAA
jgi:SOS-response transcriptional repressor LexA